MFYHEQDYFARQRAALLIIIYTILICVIYKIDYVDIIYLSFIALIFSMYII